MLDRRPLSADLGEARLGDVVSGLDAIADTAIPYSGLPRRLSLYAQEFPRWGDLTRTSLQGLSKRPKLGQKAIDALIAAAEDAVRNTQVALGADETTATAAVEHLLGRLTDAERTVLAWRCWTFRPPPSADIAEHLGVHAATVDRTYARARRRLAELTADPAHKAITEHAARLGARLGHYVSTATAAHELDRLGLDPDGQAAHVLLSLAGPYRPRGEWLENVSTDGATQVRAAIDAVFDNDPAPTPAALLGALTTMGMSPADADLYLRTHETLRHFGAVCVRWRTTSTAAMAEAVLHGLGVPSTVADIFAHLDRGVTASVDAVAGRLAIDGRFVRTSRTTWGLRAWDLEVYRGVADAIGVAIDRAGGRAPVASIVEDVLTRFPDVAESSVYNFLSTAAFVTESGFARRRTGEDAPRPLPPLNTSRGVFRNGRNEIRVVIEVDGDVMRGSSSKLRRSVAHALGVQPGEQRTFTSDSEAPATTLNWIASSTRGVGMSAPRPHAERLGARLGDRLIFAFDTAVGTVKVTRLDPSLTGLALVRQLMGRNVRNPKTALAASLECSPAEVSELLRARGDDAVVARAGLDGVDTAG